MALQEGLIQIPWVPKLLEFPDTRPTEIIPHLARSQPDKRRDGFQVLSRPNPLLAEENKLPDRFLLWQGLRIRLGLHWGQPAVDTDALEETMSRMEGVSDQQKEDLIFLTG
eukprot:282339_1